MQQQSEFQDRADGIARHGRATIWRKNSDCSDMTAIEEMARYCFGYGRWDAPYWFIGLEEGMSGTLEQRIAAWQELGKETGLSDCKQFHERIGVTDHHGIKAKPQKTWRTLILMLLTYLGLPNDGPTILEYQRTALGTCDGDTLLIELFGLPSKTMATGAEQRGLHFSTKVEDAIRFERLNLIHKKLLLHKPQLVIMYGVTNKKSFESLAGKSLEKWDIVKRGEILMTLVPHPADRYRPVADKTWIDHANRLASNLGGA